MSPDELPDDAMKALRALPAVEPPRELVHRVQRQAHAELEAATEGNWLAAASRAWTRVGLPAALTVTVIGYLAWAVNSASALYR